MITEEKKKRLKQEAMQLVHTPNSENRRIFYIDVHDTTEEEFDEALKNIIKGWKRNEDERIKENN